MHVDKVVVIGLGRFGYSLCKALASTSIEVIAVDIDEEKVENVEDFVAFPAVMDTKNLNSLKSLGVTIADVVIVSIGEDFESSLLTISFLQELGVKRIIARVINDVHHKIIKSMGITETLRPEEQSGIDLAQQLTIDGVAEAADLGDGFSVVNMITPAQFEGSSLRDSELRSNFNLNLITVKRKLNKEDEEATTLGTLDADFILEKDDIMVLFGSKKDLKTLSRLHEKE